MKPKVMDDEIIEEIWKDDEIVTQIWIGVIAKEITICETCDTIFPYTPNRKYCDECRKTVWRMPPEYQREYYQKNKTRMREYRREYRKNNLEKVLAYERKQNEKRKLMRRKRNET